VSSQVGIRAPLDEEFGPVVRLIVGGIAERANFGFEAMDDLQLAIERLLAEAGTEGHVSLTFELGESSIRATVGPLAEGSLAAALQRDGTGTGLTLARVLTTVVDSYGVEDAHDGHIVVRLEKLAEGGA
jgi:hypothetical protein